MARSSLILPPCTLSVLTPTMDVVPTLSLDMLSCVHIPRLVETTSLCRPALPLDDAIFCLPGGRIAGLIWTAVESAGVAEIMAARLLRTTAKIWSQITYETHFSTLMLMLTAYVAANLKNQDVWEPAALL